MPIEGVTRYKSLGVSIDENLSWIGHVGLCSIELRRLTNVKPLYGGYTKYLRYFDVAPLIKKPGLLVRDCVCPDPKRRSPSIA